MIFAVLLVAAPALAAAQAYPSRAIKLVVNFPPGGGTDALARVLAADLQPLLGQPVVVENRPGANGNIGADYVAKSAPDGYTLIMVNSAFAISAGLYDKLPYDTIKDFTPVILFASVPSILAVPPSFPAKNLQELIGLLKANPGKYSYASCGAGSPQHMAAELFQSMTGTRMTHVPYKGCGPALTDVIGGHVPISFNTAANSVPHITSGKLKGIAATGKKRFPLVADVPTMEEGGLAGYDVEQWYGVLGPAKLPQEAVTKLNAAIDKVMAQKAVQDKLLQQGWASTTSTPAAFGKVLRDDVERWSKLIKTLGLKVD